MQQYLFDGKKSISLENYPAQAWQELSPGLALSGNDSRADRAAAQAFYETVAWLFRCVKLRQSAISRVPWVIAKGDKEIWESGSLVPPQELQFLTGLPRLIARTEGALCLSPEAFWFREKNRVKTTSLRFLTPSSVTPIWDAEKGLVGFDRQLSTQKKRLGLDEIVYFALENPMHETIPGRPPAQAAMSAAGVLYNVDSFASAFFERGAIKPTILTAPQGTPESEKSKLRSWWRRAFQGIANAWNTEVIAAEVKPIIIGEGIAELGNVTLTNEKKEEIATALGIPHSKVFSNAANYATAQVDVENFLLDTIIPSLSLLAETINTEILYPLGYSMQLRPQEMPIFQEDENQRAQSWATLVNGGMRRSVAAEILGMNLPSGMEYSELDEPSPVRLEIAPIEEPEPIPAKYTVLEDERPVRLEISALIPEKNSVSMRSEPDNLRDILTDKGTDKDAEIARFRRWASKRKNATAEKFESDILSLRERRELLAELQGDADSEPMRPFPVLSVSALAASAS